MSKPPKKPISQHVSAETLRLKFGAERQRLDSCDKVYHPPVPVNHSLNRPIGSQRVWVDYVDNGIIIAREYLYVHPAGKTEPVPTMIVDGSGRRFVH